MNMCLEMAKTHTMPANFKTVAALICAVAVSFSAAAAIQKKLKGDPALARRVHLVTVSFDPLTDTPPVLRKHAREVDADLRTWTFLTGDRDEIDRFAARFGVSVARALNDQRDITHNLRTAIVDAEGRLVKVYTGNEWTPDQVLADVRSVRGSRAHETNT